MEWNGSRRWNDGSEQTWSTQLDFRSGWYSKRWNRKKSKFFILNLDLKNDNFANLSVQSQNKKENSNIKKKKVDSTFDSFDDIDG